MCSDSCIDQAWHLPPGIIVAGLTYINSLLVTQLFSSSVMIRELDLYMLVYIVTPAIILYKNSATNLDYPKPNWTPSTFSLSSYTIAFVIVFCCFLFCWLELWAWLLSSLQQESYSSGSKVFFC